MVIEVGFKIKSKSGIYRIETDDTDIISEKLDFTLNKNKVNFFEITKKKKISMKVYLLIMNIKRKFFPL